MKKNLIYLFFTALIILLQFNIFYFSKSVNISPDSIRFMSFWQNNYDVYQNSIVKFIYHSLKDSIKYDYNRARITQYFLYGLDVFLRRGGRNYDTNYIMLTIMYINSFLLSYNFTKSIKSHSEKILTFILIFGICSSSIYFYSSILVVILYAKHIWVTFILFYFIFNNKILQTISLFLACFSDELGLISTMIIIFIIVYNYLSDQNFSVRKSLSISFGIILILFLAFFGISAVIFNLGSGFGALSLNFGSESVHISIMERINSIIEIFSNIILGSNLFLKNKLKIFSYLLFIFITCYILIILYKKQNFEINLNYIKCRMINSRFISKHFFLFFSFFLFILINFIILPGGSGDIGHRGYARYVSILLIFFSILFSFVSINQIIKILSLIFLAHYLIFTFSQSNKNLFITKMLNIFIIDSSITLNDLNKIKISREEFVKNGKSNTFLEINNNELIDLSGTWYYSKIKNFDTTKKSYFPVKGTLQVMMWPQKIQNIK